MEIKQSIAPETFKYLPRATNKLKTYKTCVTSYIDGWGCAGIIIEVRGCLTGYFVLGCDGGGAWDLEIFALPHLSSHWVLERSGC